MVHVKKGKSIIWQMGILLIELKSLKEYTEYFSQMQFWTKGMFSFEIGTSDLG